MKLGPRSDKPCANNSVHFRDLYFIRMHSRLAPRADVATEVEIKAGQEHRSRRPSLEPFGYLHFFF